MPPCAATLCALRGLSWKQNALTLYPSSPSEAAAEAPANPVPTTMTSSLRLFAGLTSLSSNLCLSHFCANGPEGILESRVIAIANHSDTQVDTKLYAAQAETDPTLRKQKFAEAADYMQTTGMAIPTIHGYTISFVNNKSKLTGVTSYVNPDGKGIVSSVDIKGIAWAGVWQNK